MLAVMVNFRDEDGRPRRGELIDPFRVYVGFGEDTVQVEDAPDFLAVMTYDPIQDLLDVHQIPALAVIGMEEVVPT